MQSLATLSPLLLIFPLLFLAFGYLITLLTQKHAEKGWSRFYSCYLSLLTIWLFFPRHFNFKMLDVNKLSELFQLNVFSQLEKDWNSCLFSIQGGEIEPLFLFLFQILLSFTLLMPLADFLQGILPHSRKFVFACIILFSAWLQLVFFFLYWLTSLPQYQPEFRSFFLQIFGAALFLLICQIRDFGISSLWKETSLPKRL